MQLPSVYGKITV